MQNYYPKEAELIYLKPVKGMFRRYVNIYNDKGQYCGQYDNEFIAEAAIKSTGAIPVWAN